MMKRLMKIETNASTMFVTYDAEEKIVMCLDNEETNSGMDIRDVEDDSSWDMYENVDDVEAWLGIDYNNPEADRIVDEIEFE